MWLLGDAGYPLQPWLITPIPDAPHDTPEGLFNARQIRARNVIERCFGVLKQRFRCLLKHRVLHYNHEGAANIIHTCVVLHNICIKNNLELENDEVYYEDDEEPVVVAAEVEGNDWLTQGRNVRNQIINLFQE